MPQGNCSPKLLYTRVVDIPMAPSLTVEGMTVRHPRWVTQRKWVSLAGDQGFLPIMGGLDH